MKPLREGDLAVLGERLEAAEHELEDLRAIRDALTPPELPQRPGLELAAAFLPAAAEQVSGDFYLVAEGPQDSTVLVVGDVVGHGLQAARRAAFIRTAFAVTATFGDPAAAELGEHRADRAGRDQRRFRHRRLRHVPPERATPALGLRRPSSGAVVG